MTFINKKISVVMAYYNREEQLIRTLRSINFSSLSKNIEVIIVDDNSDKPVSEFLNSDLFNFEIKLFRINNEDKLGVNPCVVYNYGFNHCCGDIIIIQNPENFWVGDVAKYVYANMNLSTYFVFSCFASSLEYSNKILSYCCVERIRDDVLMNKIIENSNGIWYNHPIYNNTKYHFCSAICRENLIKLNGFDNRYKDGYGYDDNEFLHRISNFLNVINISPYKNPFVIHQYHNLFYNDDLNNNIEKIKLYEKNKNLFLQDFENKDRIKVNENDIIIL